MTGEKKDTDSTLKKLGVLTTVPIFLLLGPLVGFLIGHWLDRKTHLYPWFTVIFVVLGFIASGREVVRLLKEIAKDNK